MRIEDLTKSQLVKELRKLEKEKYKLVTEYERIRESEYRYRMIFDHSNISIWEEDYSAVYSALESLKKQGIVDLKSYLTDHPDIVGKIVRNLRVIDVNPATLKIYNARSKEEFLGSLDKVFVPEAASHFINEMTAIAEGARHYEGETVGRKLTGELMTLLLRITIPESGKPSDYSRVLVAIVDITESKRREEENLKLLQMAESLRTTSLALTSTMNRDTILDIILDESLKTIPYTAVTVALLEHNYIKVVRHRGIEPYFATLDEIQYIYNHPKTISIRQVKNTQKPVLISDTLNNPNWHPFKSTSWARSYLAMPINVKNKVIGLVSFYGKEPGMFSKETIHTIEPFVLSAGVALENARLFEEVQKELIEKREAEKKIRQSLEEKNILLMEVHHRVKNNLNIVASLLNLQSSQIETIEQAKNALQISQSRVHSMSLVHENLYQSKDLSHIDIAVYLEKIAGELVNLFTTDTDIHLGIQAENTFLTVNQAVPLGLLLNELITNAIIHAFPGRTEGNLSITMSLHAGTRYRLIISDDGIGIPANIDPDTTPSLGLHLAKILAQQLGGELAIGRKEGTTITLTFPVKNEKSMENSF